eukprot:Seg664.1 transcript_id=Seg664.1/GoldUCD/mRNA.D3Y31 product="Jerky protein-like-like" protein_id=Seg664.1/GoldUCD/D3Y31
MPGTHPKPREKKGQYTTDQLRHAINAVNEGVSIYRASIDFSIPKETLRRKLKLKGEPVKFIAGKQSVLTDKEEQLICEWVKENAKRGFGRTPDHVCEAVRHILDRGGRKVESFDNNRPGKSWWYGFLRRHPDLHMVKPRPLELARATACSEKIVYGWFDEFEKFLCEHKIDSPDQIYNCDESGFPLQACSSKKVCVDKVTKRTFHLTSSSKTSITTLQCICANGTVVPPAVYFSGKSFNPEYSLGFPKNFFLGFSDSGWMEIYHFFAWVANHFVKRIPPIRPVLLLIDGHVSHIDFHTTMFCKENQILLFRLPPHTSHVMQPADRGFFNVFKGEWRKTCSKFSFENPGVVVSKRTFSRVFVEAFDRTARPDIVKSSFRCSGIWPVNRYAIDPSAFAPAKTFQEQKTPAESNNISVSVPTNGNELNDPAPSTSTPKKDQQTDDRHPTIKALEGIEKAAGAARVNLFETRFEEGYDINDDCLYVAWKVLKENKIQIDLETSGESSFSRSTLSEDLCPIIKSVLTYPQMKKSEGKKARKKINLPKHMTWGEALKVLEAQDIERRRKENVKEVNRVKRQKKIEGKENKENAENEKTKEKKEEKQKSKKTTKKRKNDKKENMKGAKRKFDDYKDDDVFRCGQCDEEYDESEEWVKCDSCELWFHVRCTELSTFDLVDIEEIDWKCFVCEE